MQRYLYFHINALLVITYSVGFPIVRQSSFREMYEGKTFSKLYFEVLARHYLIYMYPNTKYLLKYSLKYIRLQYIHLDYEQSLI